MPVIDTQAAALVVIDLQGRLMPAISGGGAVIAAANRLIRVAEALEVPVVFTEQNPRGLGGTVAEVVGAEPRRVVSKMSFDAAAEPAFLAALGDARTAIVVGCEAHVCVLQTVLGLLRAGRRVFVVEDAIGSRAPENRARAIARMQANGAEIVTSEMAIFEWLGTAENPKFRAVLDVVKAG